MQWFLSLHRCLMKIISSVPEDQRLLDFAKQNSYHDYNHALDGFIFLSKRRGIQHIFHTYKNFYLVRKQQMPMLY